MRRQSARLLWGKRKVGAALPRDVAGFDLSDSTIGRIRPAAVVAGRAKPRRRRAFGGHAKRWHLRHARRPTRRTGSDDRMSVSFPGATLKSFTTVCPATGCLAARATRHTAACLLDHALRPMPLAVNAKNSKPQGRIINASKKPPDCLKCIEPVQNLSD